MSTGSIDYLGAEQRFSILAGSARVHELRFTDSAGEPLDISDVTFDGVCKARDGKMWGMEVSHVTPQDGTLAVVFPALDAGQYAYELRAVDAGGEKRRMVFGVLSVLSTVLDLGSDEEEEAEKLRLDVRIPGRDARRIMLEWHATTRAAQAAERAEDAALKAEREADRAGQEADRAEGAANGVREELEVLTQRAEDAVGKVENMEGRLGAIDEHIRNAIVPHPETNTWWIAGVDSHYPVTGEAGRSPYVGTRGTWMVWDEELQAFVDTGLDPEGKPGVSPKIAANGNWLCWNDQMGVWEDTGVCAAGHDGVDGTAVRRILVDSAEDIPQEGETCTGGVYYYVPVVGSPDSYEIFAWLEQPGGTPSWVRVGEASDIATSEIYGLVKTATDVTVEGGAPVGTNSEGQLSVPRADYTMPGTVLPSVAATLEAGGCIGFDEEGRLLAEEAEYHKQGSVALSFNGLCDVPCVGLMADDTIGLPWATLNQPGVIKLGSAFQQLNRIPYQQGVGSTSNHQISNNLLYGGAVQHKKLRAWLQNGMEWLAEIPATPYLNDNDYYMGLVVSAQFTQSEAAGLELEPATADVLAGVHLARSMEDNRPTAVPLASTVREWSFDAHYTKEQEDAKFQAIYTKFEDYSTTVQMHDYVSDRLQAYVTLTALDSRVYATTNYVDALDAQNMKTSPSVRKIYVLEPDEFESTRGNRDPQALYIKATMK